MSELSFFQYLSRIEKGENLAPVNFFFGYNEFLGEILLSKLSDMFLEEKTEFNFKRYYFDNEKSSSWQELIEEAKSSSFFIQSRKILVAVIRDPSMIFSSKSDLEIVSSYINEPNEDTILVIYLSLNLTPDDFKNLKRSKLKKIFVNIQPGSANLVDMDKISESGILDYVKRYLLERGITISPSALDKISEIKGEDLTTIMYQLNMLEISSPGGGNIDSSDIEELISGSSSHSIWELSETIERKDSESYLKILNYLFTNGTKPQVIIGTLVAHYNKIYIAKFMLGRNFPADEIGRSLNQPRFLLKKFLNVARNFSALKLERIGKLLYNLDYESKTGGERSARILLQNFIFQI